MTDLEEAIYWRKKHDIVRAAANTILSQICRETGHSDMFAPPCAWLVRFAEIVRGMNEANGMVKANRTAAGSLVGLYPELQNLQCHGGPGDPEHGDAGTLHETALQASAVVRDGTTSAETGGAE